MTNVRIKTDNRQKKLFIINLVLIIPLVLLCYADFGNWIFRFIIFGYYLTAIFVFLGKCINNTVDVADIVTVFFLMYNIFATIVFSFKSIIEKLQIFMSSAIPTDERGIRVYLTVLLVSAMVYMHILIDITGKRINNKERRKVICLHYDASSFLSLKITKKQFMIIPVIIAVLVYLFYVNKLTGGVYIAYSGIVNADRIFNLIGWISIIGSGAIFAGFSLNKENNNKIIYFALIFAAVMFWKLKIRMYCAMFAIECIICAYLRGFRFKKTHMALLFAGGILLLFGNVLRFSVYSFGNIYNDIFTVFGEFIASSISGYYLVNNPLGFDGGIRMRDLLFQLLPSAVRPVPALDDFYTYYVAEGINPWPAGGILFQGQLFFYLGILSYFVFLLTALYLFYVRRKMEEGKMSAGLAMFPVFCMSMPRLPIWLLRSMLVAGGIYFLISLLSSYQYSGEIQWKKTAHMMSESLDGDNG